MPWSLLGLTRKSFFNIFVKIETRFKNYNLLKIFAGINEDNFAAIFAFCEIVASHAFLRSIIAALKHWTTCPAWFARISVKNRTAHTVHCLKYILNLFLHTKATTFYPSYCNFFRKKYVWQFLTSAFFEFFRRYFLTYTIMFYLLLQMYTISTCINI
jgi:hypothetical protein